MYGNRKPPPKPPTAKNGLTEKQKKNLPKKLQDAILAKQKGKKKM